MNVEELFRRYLEQRREMGESELVLDTLTVDEVLRIVGAQGKRAPAPRDVAAADDWRSVLRGAEAELPRKVERIPAREAPQSSAPRVPAPAPPPAPAIPTIAVAQPTPPSPRRGTTALSALAPQGLVVGGGDVELFGGPITRAASLDDIAEMVRTCTRCPLYATATNPVPGEGSPTAQLMCIGEAPGATEDETGRPFVGQAGKLLTDILRAIKLSREEVFIANVMKHRPPGNRNPVPDEITACSPYLLRQVELIRPRVILALGTFAAQTLLDTKVAIGKLRGLMHWYHGTPLIATYHPAALLRNPGWKKPTWEDVKLVRRILDSVAA
ncbi:MAG TPA: uracil-DNA glycosylase [Gemmatimonadaceae bacterium]|nr:uracil-DNA glycosylase [Gemmatimonadaceae bacterium]